ncbi:hypothetical protein H4R35_000475 [Dimargaris xerosporica]|nr:hypothetical protein H4R35_000475 [Dimargaris xerosporica]
MGIFKKIKQSFLFTHLEVGKYTKRRASTVPEYDTKSREFYEKNYTDGYYLHRPNSGRHPLGSAGQSVGRSRSCVVRCSETYNLS